MSGLQDTNAITKDSSTQVIGVRAFQMEPPVVSNLYLICGLQK